MSGLLIKVLLLLLLQVCAMRMPVDMLLVWLPQMLEGMLIWADDSKNKFRLKVNIICLLTAVWLQLVHEIWLLYRKYKLLQP